MKQEKDEKKIFEALSKANAVEGFDPDEALVLINVTDPETNETKSILYMEAGPAMAWFYTVHPDGAIVPEIIYRNDKLAIVKASVYFNINDPMPRAVGFAERSYSDDKYGKNYINNASVLASRRALGLCGFGTPLGAQVTEKQSTIPYLPESIDNMADDGIPVVAKLPKPPTVQQRQKAKENTKAKAPVPDFDEIQAETQKMPDEAEITNDEKDLVDSCQVSSDELIPPEEVPVVIAAPTVVEKKQIIPPPVAKMNADENKPMTLEEAETVIIPFGKAKGMSIAIAGQTFGPSIIRWYLEKQEDQASLFARAAKIYCTANNC